MSRETMDRISDQDLIETQRSPDDAAAATTDEKDEDIIVWEVWDKIEGKVCFVRESDSMILRTEDDPLGLPGFFPSLKPLQPLGLTGTLTPICPFTVYKTLADELDTTTKRINKIVKGLKVRGIVAGNAEKLIALAEADDNEIVVESQLESLVQNGGIDRAIAWWPVEQAIKVLAQLYQQREQIKASIYEITGISDIVRGASNAGETATAQQIKTQWGSLRIQKMQRLIERQIRDIFVQMAHLITTKFSPETIVRMTGIEVTPGIQQLMMEPADAHFRVNVETDSTVRADLTRQKQDMQEFLAGSAQFFATAGPIIQQQPQAAEPLAEVYAATTRFFKLGKQVEDALERFVNLAKQAAENPPPNPEAERAKAEMAMKEKEMQQRMTLEGQKGKIEIAKGELDLKAKKMDIEERAAQSLLDQRYYDEDGNEIEPSEKISVQAMMQQMSDLGMMMQQMVAAQSAPK